ncbi:MAG: FKBP-type peptidyl-prolyl cis-trans isomerase, partial [Clostridia bacterium]|nr:FKBP-type peptidyl-prolyl cis-trans isomerase [Clostridia bacterium]
MSSFFKKLSAFVRKHVKPIVVTSAVTGGVIVLTLAILLPILLIPRKDTKVDGIIEFDYERTNLSKYISVSRDDYFGLPVTIDKIPAIAQKDVDDYINEMRLYYSEASNLSDGVIAKNDTVSVFYRGQVEVDGKWVDFVGGSNLGSSAGSLVIGSGNFIDGFEEALEGREFTNSKLTTFTGKDKVVGKDGLPIVFVSYSYKYTDENNKEKKGTFIDRISLEKDAGGNYVETQRYSAALRDALLGDPTDEDEKNTIGTTLSGPYTESFDITGDLVPEAVTLTSVKITGIVKEDVPFVFDVAFPAEYEPNPELAGKTAKWYVYVSALSRPTLPTVDYDFVNGKLGLTYADVLDYIPEGTPVDSTAQQKAAVVAAFPHYVKAYLEENRERSVTEAVVDAYWKAILDKVEVKAWPEYLVEDVTLMLRNQVTASFDDYVDNYGNDSIATLEEYIVQYFGEEYFPNGEDSIDEGLDAAAKEYI